MDPTIFSLTLIGGSLALVVYLAIRKEKKSSDEPVILHAAKHGNKDLKRTEHKLFAPEIEEKHENSTKNVKAVYVEKARAEEHGHIHEKKKKKRKKRNRKHNRRY